MPIWTKNPNRGIYSHSADTWSHISEAQLVTKIHQDTEQSRTAMGLKPWLSVKETLDEYMMEFKRFFPDIEQRIEAARHRAHQRGTPFLIIDIGGVLDASAIDAQTICVTLTDPKLPKIPGRTILCKDILSPKGLHALEEAVRAAGIPVGLVFFNPQGGATFYAHNPFAYRRIGKVLKLMHEQLEPDGDVYGGVRFPVNDVRWSDIDPTLRPDLVTGDIEPGRRFWAFHWVKEVAPSHL